MHRFDLAVLGSGFAGSLMSMIARRLGLSVVLIEKGTHPRTVIGESSTPLSNLLLESLADRYDLPMLKPLTKWGTWQQAHPEIACGLKRGFTFFHHTSPGQARCAADRQLLVAASPHDAVADTHWFRADFDQFLVQQATGLGAVYLDACAITEVDRSATGWDLQCRRNEEDLHLHADFVVDASGPRGALHRLLGLEELPLPGYPATCALYSHFKGVANFAGQQQHSAGAPYPPDAAALHHVFDGGWIWILHFNNGLTSAGVAASRATSQRFGLAEKAAGWDRLLQSLPEVQEQFRSATPQMPFTFMPQLSYRSATIAGPGWAMLPSAAGFVDPLLSTGFPLTLLGVSRLAEILERDWKSTRTQASLATYAALTERELLATAGLIAALYANMKDFAMFRTLSLLYFAAASYAETVRRLGKPGLANGFLLHANPRFGPALHRITHRAQGALDSQEKVLLQKEIYALIEQFDIAGLCKQPEDHCYPVRAEDLFDGAHKVQATQQEIESMLRRAGFYGAGTPGVCAAGAVKENGLEATMPAPSCTVMN